MAATVPAATALDAAREMVRIWEGASQDLLGHPHRVSVQVVCSNERYFKDDKTETWWNAISKQIGEGP